MKNKRLLAINAHHKRKPKMINGHKRHKRLWKTETDDKTSHHGHVVRVRTDALNGPSMHAADGRFRQTAEIQLLWYKTKKHDPNARVPNDVPWGRPTKESGVKHKCVYKRTLAGHHGWFWWRAKMHSILATTSDGLMLQSMSIVNQHHSPVGRTPGRCDNRGNRWKQ